MYGPEWLHALQGPVVSFFLNMRRVGEGVRKGFEGKKPKFTSSYKCMNKLVNSFLKYKDRQKHCKN